MNDDGTSKDLTLKLARDDAPIGGRIIDLEGRPVAGARLTVLDVRVPVDGSLDAWLKALEERGEFNRLDAQPNPPIIPPVVTGQDGGFRIGGIGPGRVVKLQIEGPTIETKRVQVRTRPGPVLRNPRSKNSSREEPVIVYGVQFEHVAAPTRPIEGVVRDADTGRPLGGIMVHGDQNLGGFYEYVECISDAQGRYRLVGLPRGQEGSIVAIPPCDFPYYGSRKAQLNVPADEALPYLRSKVRVETTLLRDAIPLDIRLKRGVWVTGRIIDQATREPVAGQVQYYVFADNPQVHAYPGYRAARGSTHFVGGDGAFRLVAFPGPGLLAARADGGPYMRGAGVERIKNKSKDGYYRTYPSLVVPDNFHVLDQIDPAPGTSSLAHDLALESGRSLTVTALGPDGKPMADLFAIGLIEMRGWEKATGEKSSYTVSGLKPGRDRTVGFLHEKKGLVGEIVIRGDETRPQTVRLQPWGVLTGRVVDSDGQPSGEGRILPFILPKGYPEVGKDGRFRIEGIVPGKSYDLRLMSKKQRILGFLAKDVKIGSGEIKDLGDVVPRTGG